MPFWVSGKMVVCVNALDKNHSLKITLYIADTKVVNDLNE